MAAGASNPQQHRHDREQRGQAAGPDIELCFISLCQPKVDAYGEQDENAGHVYGRRQGDSSLYLLAECHDPKPKGDASRSTVTRRTQLNVRAIARKCRFCAHPVREGRIGRAQDTTLILPNGNELRGVAAIR